MENNQEKKVETSENKKIENEENFQKPSYTYWKRESDKPFSNEFVPQKSNPAIDANNNQTESNTKTGSAWNKAGTWEEKHFNKNQIEEFFNKSFNNSNKKFNEIFKIEKIGSYSGDVILFLFIFYFFIFLH